MLFGAIKRHRRKKKIKRILDRLAINSIDDLHHVRKKHYKDMLFYEKKRDATMAAYHRGAKDLAEWLLKGE